MYRLILIILLLPIMCSNEEVKYVEKEVEVEVEVEVPVEVEVVEEEEDTYVAPPIPEPVPEPEPVPTPTPVPVEPTLLQTGELCEAHPLCINWYDEECGVYPRLTGNSDLCESGLCAKILNQGPNLYKCVEPGSKRFMDSCLQAYECNLSYNLICTNGKCQYQ